MQPSAATTRCAVDRGVENDETGIGRVHSPRASRGEDSCERGLGASMRRHDVATLLRLGYVAFKWLLRAAGC